MKGNNGSVIFYRSQCWSPRMVVMDDGLTMEILEDEKSLEAHGAENRNL
jgi:hypothetical protein